MKILGTIFFVLAILYILIKRRDLIKFSFRPQKKFYYRVAIWVLLLLVGIFILDKKIAYGFSNKYPSGITSLFPKLTVNFTIFFKMVTHLGEPEYISLFMFPTFLYGKWKKHRRLENIALGTFGAMITGSLISSVLKIFFMRSRPFQEWNNLGFYFIEDVFEKEIPFKGSYMSFPSGHTMVAFCSYIFLSLVSKRTWAKLLWFFLALLVGFSRIYLSAHWLSDVIASGFLAMIVAKNTQLTLDQLD